MTKLLKYDHPYLHELDKNFKEIPKGIFVYFCLVIWGKNKNIFTPHFIYQELKKHKKGLFS